MATPNEETVRELVWRAADGDLVALAIIADRLGQGDRAAGLTALEKILEEEDQ